MTTILKDRELPLEELRWTLDPEELPFKTTADLEPEDEIIGQDRGVEAFRFGMGMPLKGYNIFVTGPAGTGKQATVKKMLKDLSKSDKTPDDLLYVNNFKSSEAPVLIRMAAGEGAGFKKDIHEFLESIKRDVPQLFESQEYIARKNEIIEKHEKQTREFFQGIEEKVKDSGLVIVNMQMGHYQRPDVVPLVDGEPIRMIQLEEKVEKGRFPREEFENLKEKQKVLKEEVDNILVQVRKLQKEVKKKSEGVDKLMFMTLAQDLINPLKEKYTDEKVIKYFDGMLENMRDDLDALRMMGRKPQAAEGGMMFMPPQADAILHTYQVNLLVDNSEQSGPPVRFETYPTYRNLFGSIERVMDRHGGWRTDFTKIKAGSFIKANGGYLVINLMDAIVEPGVWPTLKRSLKTEKIEIQTFDPYYFISSTGLKPEPIAMDVKVVVLGEPYLYQLLRHYDPDVPKIFKVRADFETSMDRDEDAINAISKFITRMIKKDNLMPFDRSGVAAIIEQAVRMAGRQEKITTSFPLLADLLGEASYFAGRNGSGCVMADHVDKAINAHIKRANRAEEQLQEMIDRGSLYVDTDGAVTGQVNGLAVYSMGDYSFGKPSRITAVTAMGKGGIINIERESDMSGPTHNKGIFILSGFLRNKFAQEKPLSLTASIAFEQSYGGIDGDSASSTELYALLSSLADVPIRQDIAVTGSVNQKGEVQPIGGVNQKIEGFYLCCKHAGLTGNQGVMIPEPNVKDLMLHKDVVKAVREGKFHVWSVKNISQGVEILTGLEAGVKDSEGKYPEKSIYGKVDAKLIRLAEGLKAFAAGNEEKDEKKKSGGGCCSK
ncbi:ATP-binding protein [Maridesulfovibrio hydrothermalis]|uniref:endopeptidase La n=1 Tax=Maridesulfovibrio hydrothermalis AM13 = DSM 14728 TaxID=1121451 RepID=L0R7J2_9BACT|nr:ATP-binding protein [Maridesulfovibrio hydrothermalis]CCO22187.1 Peptidase S16 lon domain protein [Maridesulfovibrio hydrothermalis AM13 = DSM 14728]